MFRVFPKSDIRAESSNQGVGAVGSIGEASRPGEQVEGPNL